MLKIVIKLSNSVVQSDKNIWAKLKKLNLCVKILLKITARKLTSNRLQPACLSFQISLLHTRITWIMIILTYWYNNCFNFLKIPCHIVQLFQCYSNAYTIYTHVFISFFLQKITLNKTTLKWLVFQKKSF